ncbi:L-threonylcarbamoyladenylate synthase [Ligilactobacillus cholophilus]|uniref:L-threonylcarbamoyladenylate synthase n=1 Tax=Ligilactobacillus cholophilus TaxID=3050131 RepID=UPI0025B269BD|nr:L-threonylcarbamoyladenylate synthase [Ligilactobacillus cholophilus]
MEITKIYQPSEVDQAAREIQLGELIAFPTETVYGLGADVNNEKAVLRVFQAKNRPADNPLNVTVANSEMVKKYVNQINDWGQKLIQNFWPGPLTLIFKIKSGSLPKVVTGGLTTAAFRCPDNKVTLELIEKAGTPIVGPSANTSGKPSPTSAQHVFHDMEGKIAGIIDDGPTAVGMESTIIDLSGDTPVIVRPGAISTTEIEKVLGMPIKMKKQASAEKYKHYNPNANVMMVSDSDWSDAIKWASQQMNIGIMATTNIIKKVPENVITYDLGENINSASRKFFAGIRELDSKGVDTILVQQFPEIGLGEAYMNRLRKASADQMWQLK